MKPIKLSLAGLNSYRKMQTVDFETLCDGGVFGIFGPTGSGKSTILDAITLALYGKVERAANNTQGIMNHAEDQLYVSFTFELEDGRSKKRYTVERTFKRVDNVRINTRLCRLLEIGEETVVLADKTNDVNDKIYELLGLTIEDFTRAVVLPQGKFAEFLSLKGSERRKMFERLFNLERFGDQLNKKLKKRLLESRQQFAELSAEQAGLGDASKEAVLEAEKTFIRCDTVLKEREKQLDEAAKEFERIQTIWNLQTEKTTYEKKRQELEQEKERFQEIEEKLKKAEQAEMLKPYAEAVLEHLAEKDRFEKETEHWQQEEKKLASLYKEKKKAFEAIRAKKAVEEPELLTKRELLKQLISLDAEIKEDEASFAKLKEDYEALKMRLHEKQHTERKTSELLNRALEKQQALKQQAKEETVSREFREKIQKAYQQKLKIMQLMKDEYELKSKKQKKEDQLNEWREKADEFARKKSELNERLAGNFNQLQKVYDRLCSQMREHEFFKEKVKDDLQAAKSQLEEERTNQAAALISEQLTEGEPCPVCGSTHHPAPNRHFSIERLKKLEETTQQLERIFKECDQTEQLYSSLKQKLQELTEDLQAEQSFLAGVKEIASANEEPIITMDDKPHDLLAYDKFKIEWKALNQDYLEIKDAIRKTIADIREVNHITAQIEPLLDAGGKDLSEIMLQLQNVIEQLEEEKRKWDLEFADLDMDQIEMYVKEISKKDSLVEQLHERIEKSVSFIQEKEQEIERLREEILNLSSQLAAKKGEMDRQAELIADKQKRLTAQRAAKENLLTELKRIDLALEQLKRDEQAAYDIFQKTANEYQKAESQLHTAKQQLTSCISKLEKAEKNWNDRKQQTPFANVHEVRNSVLQEEEKLAMQTSLDQYKKEMEHVASAIERLEEKLGGTVLKQETWEETKKCLEEARKQVNEAMEQRGAAAKHLQLLKEKHERYVEIEKEKEELQLLLNRLEKLQAVLKGNSFVEYMAEEQLQQISFDASQRLGELTRQRYAIEVDSEGGFIMRDDANGGVKRPVSTLSGGETFLTSLALALSLSTQIQLRGKYPLQFFFLDEGFGTLDAELLDTVVSALEKLQSQNLSVGVISHVQELRERLPKRLIIEPAEPSGNGTTVRIETI
ncbi:exonuclease SbcC [Aeribacillus composti]|uniref:SbcC/MukB-like Walker B domain-containing protein n=1 Tax=Aeribacillus composti TaxID=1868734 RepID=UPI00119B45C7|nr:SMC family ATPase [Aeribacillus composti]TVZ89240.1 exonuclease SbcC [Aeribacillus composti]